ncbi:hypothetical protein B0J14DRAFT_687243 [Halenospora varia]|nr:hypothetical protein B0J14DRAFT_687243 [Halenospora varia]
MAPTTRSMDRGLGNNNQNNSSLPGSNPSNSNYLASSSGHDLVHQNYSMNTNPSFEIHADGSDATSMTAYKESLEDAGTANQFNDSGFVDDDSVMFDSTGVVELQGPQYGSLSGNPSTFGGGYGDTSSVLSEADGPHAFFSKSQQQGGYLGGPAGNSNSRAPLGELSVPVSRAGNDGSVMTPTSQEDVMGNSPQPDLPRRFPSLSQRLNAASRAQIAGYSNHAVGNQSLTLPTSATSAATTNSNAITRASRSTHTNFDGSNDSGEQYIHKDHPMISTRPRQSRLRPATPPPVDPYAEPPTTFPLPPQDLILPPPRLPPQTPALQKLDNVFDQKEHLILDTQKYGRGEDESKSQLAWETLQQYREDRMPFVKLSSQRLQAVLGVRNELAFELPDTPVEVQQRRASLSPQMRRLYDAPTSGMRSTSRSSPLKPSSVSKHGRNRIAQHAKDLSISTQSRRDSGIGLGSIHGPKSPVGFGTVDKETGRGPREFLLQKGRAGGMRKRECQAVSLHDFTGNMKGGGAGNLLLGNFEAGRGRRIDLYEVDLPATQVDPTTGQVFQTTETWIWFLISRPLLTLTSSSSSSDDDDPSTSTTTSAAASTGNTPFYSPQTHSSRIPPAAHPIPPPNFPHPIPTSWVVFALPLANCTAYTESIEDLSSSSSSERETSFDSAYHSFSQRKDNVIHKRADFDLSHSGIPIFEFSQKPKGLFKNWAEFCAKHGELDLNSGEPTHEDSVYGPGVKGEFLCVDEMPGWDRGKDNDAGFNGSVGKEWWDKWNTGMACEVERWGDIKRAMGRGKCRVVVRWEESTLPPAMLDDSDIAGMGMGMGMGMDVDEALGMTSNSGLGVSGLGAKAGMGMNHHNPHPSKSNSTRPPGMTGIGTGSSVRMGMGIGGRPKRTTRSSLSSQLVNTPGGYIGMGTSNGVPAPSPSVAAAAGSANRKKNGKKGKGRKR